MHNNTLIQWDAPEFVYHKKSVDWYWAILISTISVAIASFIFKNYLFSFLVVIAGSSMVYFGMKKPETIHFSIKEDGIRAKNIFFPFESILNYDIHENEKEPKIIILTNRAFLPIITLPAHSEILIQIDSILSKHVEHVELREPGIYKLLDKFGF